LETTESSVAVPVPDPAPVAVNFKPTVFAEAPIAVKSVVPIVAIVYVDPTIKFPAVTAFFEFLTALTQ
jgi:hypothetical protein